MSSSYSKLYIHFVWSTRYREPIICPEWRDRLNAYIRGSFERAGCEVLSASTVANHVHILVWVPFSVPIPSVVQAAKGASARFVNTSLNPDGTFHWQEGYSGHSVSKVLLPVVIRYIENQADRHADLDIVFEQGYPRVGDFEIETALSPTGNDCSGIPAAPDPNTLASNCRSKPMRANTPS